MKQYTNKETKETVHAFQWMSGHDDKVGPPPEADDNQKIAVCKKCNHFYMDHGYVEGKGFVCPGNYMVFGEDMDIVTEKDFKERFDAA